MALAPHADPFYSDRPDLYVQRTDGSAVTQLTTDPADDACPCFSPDGKQIAFASGRSGRQKIHVINADGSEAKKLTDGEFLDAWPAWRPVSSMRWSTISRTLRGCSVWRPPCRPRGVESSAVAASMSSVRRVWSR